MTKPLAVVFYESLMPGSQLVNRLADLGWRTRMEAAASAVAAAARQEPPMVIIAELKLRHGDFCGVIKALKEAPETSHIPVIGFAPLRNTTLRTAALAAGAALVAADNAILEQLPQLLEHVLSLD